ncbi:MAG: hypothetical protein WDO18_20555 [Acidobacteriota bacterium]
MGSLYVTGTTTSSNLTVTPGVYLPTLPALQGRPRRTSSMKLNRAGALEWSTYFIGGTVASIAVDAAGYPYIGGASGGGLPTTPGAYTTDFKQSITSNGFFSVMGPLSAFVTKFNALGTGLIYSTYVPTDNQKQTVASAPALAIDAAGNAWLGVGLNPGIVPTGPGASIVELNATGSAVLASVVQPGLGNVAAIAFDANSNVYVAGARTPQGGNFPATPGAFQSVPQPIVPTLDYQPPSGGGTGCVRRQVRQHADALTGRDIAWR